MKKLALVVLMAFGLASNAQETTSPTAKGKFVIEANTGSHATGNTSFTFLSVDGESRWNIGLDGGYFVADDFAVKLGLGYGDNSLSDEGIFSYKVGAEYYILSKIPVGVDFTGQSVSDNSINYVGLQAGYAWFLGENVSVKPALRYNLAIDEGVNNAFQGLIGFALYF